MKSTTEMINQSQKLDHIDLNLITISKSNQLFRDQKDLKPEGLKELSDSIKQTGVIQPVLVMQDHQNPGKYILICGERRFRASMLAGKENIPAYIFDVKEDEAFELQMIENLQRENVHPLKEAQGFKAILDKNPTITTKELGLRFGKSESYIIQRLKLNDLVAEAKKDFLNNRMNLGHALLLSRLSEENQKEVIEENSNNRDGFGTVNDLEDYINRHIVNNLASAPFSKEDVNLYTKAGACITCPKRSGAAPLLFAEVKEKNRCFDKGCFNIKCNTFIINKINDVIETQPDVVFITGYQEPIPQVLEMLEQHKIKVLKEYTHFSEDDKKGSKVKGMWINGKNVGKIQEVYLKRLVSTGDEVMNDKIVITKIQERVKRGRELDDEKVYARIINEMKKHANVKKDSDKKLNSDEEIFLLYMIYDKAGYQLKIEIRKMIGISKETPELVYNTLKSLSAPQKAVLLRKVMLDQYSGIYPNSNQAFIIRKIAESYLGIDIKTFEAEQEQIRIKREAKAKEKISLLQKNAKVKIKK